MMNEYCLSSIERGKIIDSGADGYTVLSHSRPGITAYGLKDIFYGREIFAPTESGRGNVEISGFEIGDQVYFCLFPDGSGIVIGKRS